MLKRFAMDHAINLALETTPPPRRPEIVHEGQWLSPTTDSDKRSAERAVAQFEHDIATWAEELAQVRAQLVHGAVAERAIVSTIDLSDVIAEIESVAEQKALEYSRCRNRIRMFLKELFFLDASVAANARGCFRRIDKADKSGIQSLLDHAVFLRALRAERTRESTSNSTVDDIRQKILMSAA